MIGHATLPPKGRNNPPHLRRDQPATMTQTSSRVLCTTARDIIFVPSPINLSRESPTIAELATISTRSWTMTRPNWESSFDRGTRAKPIRNADHRTGLNDNFISDVRALYGRARADKAIPANRHAAANDAAWTDLRPLADIRAGTDHNPIPNLHAFAKPRRRMHSVKLHKHKIMVRIECRSDRCKSQLIDGAGISTSMAGGLSGLILMKAPPASCFETRAGAQQIEKERCAGRLDSPPPHRGHGVRAAVWTARTPWRKDRPNLNGRDCRKTRFRHREGVLFVLATGAAQCGRFAVQQARRPQQQRSARS